MCPPPLSNVCFSTQNLTFPFYELYYLKLKNVGKFTFLMIAGMVAVLIPSAPRYNWRANVEAVIIGSRYSGSDMVKSKLISNY